MTMKTTARKEVREKIEKRLKKIKYRLYQSEIRFASHDNEGLIETIRKIRWGCSDILKELIGTKVKRAAAKIKTAKKASGRR
jgi:hypothetical protein